MFHASAGFALVGIAEVVREAAASGRERFGVLADCA